MIYFDDSRELLVNLNLTTDRPLLIGIDGRPCAGKSTLADEMADFLNAQSIFLDDFYIPPADWPKNIQPAFPFPYFRYEEFANGIQKLAMGLTFHYQPFDWETKQLSKSRIIDPKNIIIVEGVSVLSEALAGYFHKKILVISDLKSELKAIAARENQKSMLYWEQLYLPSLELYWRTKPWTRADILFAGRGVPNKEAIDEFVG